MAFTVNNSEVSVVNFNGQAVTAVNFNGVNVWEGNITIISNGNLQTGNNRVVVNESYAYYPTDTAVVIKADKGDADGDGSHSAYCTVRYDKSVVCSGQKLYVQTNSATTYSEPVTAVYKVQLVNVSTGETITLGQYAYDWNGTVFDGVTGDVNKYNSVINKLVSYDLPSSGTYYIQFRYYVHDWQTQNVTYDIIHCYTKHG